MRKREQIEKDPKPPEFLILEILLDVRDLIEPKGTKTKPRKRGRPKKKNTP